MSPASFPANGDFALEACVDLIYIYIHLSSPETPHAQAPAAEDGEDGHRSPADR